MTDKNGRRGEHHERQRDAGKLFPRARAVYLCRLVKIGVHVGEDARCEQHGGGYAHPRIDGYADEPRHPLRISAEEAYRLSAVLYDELVDRSSVRKHEFEPEQRDEPRHGISKHGKRAPERLAFHTLLVEEQRKPQPEEVIDESGKHSPKDVPAEDLKEAVRDVGKSDQFLEIVQPHPAHEFGRHGLAAVIRESDENHEHYRQDIEYKHSDHGQEEHGLVKLLVQQPLRLVEELRGTLACRERPVECGSNP